MKERILNGYRSAQLPATIVNQEAEKDSMNVLASRHKSSLHELNNKWIMSALDRHSQNCYNCNSVAEAKAASMLTEAIEGFCKEFAQDCLWPCPVERQPRSPSS